MNCGEYTKYFSRKVLLHNIKGYTAFIVSFEVEHIISRYLLGIEH